MTFRNKRTARRAGKLSGQTRRARQMEHVARVFVRIQKCRDEGRGWRFIADMLNAGGVGAPRGGVWYPTTVKRVYEAGKRSGVQLDLIEKGWTEGECGAVGVTNTPSEIATTPP